MITEDTQKVAIVTGGSSGIGRVIVERLLQANYRVAYCGRTRQHVEASQAYFEANYAKESVLARTQDLADTDSINTLVTEAEARWGRVSVMIYNAGYSPKRDGVRVPLHEVELDEWHTVFSVNITAAFRYVQLVLPGMMEARYGRIILTGSMGTRDIPRFGGAAYVASKAALSGLMHSLVSEYSEYGITTNVIAPGNIITNMTETLDPATWEQVVGRVPLGRLGRPEDIAGAVLLLCSTDGSFINGATIDVNGGEYLAP